jgi:hypothetical protein
MTDMGRTWRDKDDLDLTSDDISTMLDEGTPVGTRGPDRYPAGGTVVRPASTFSTASKVNPSRREAALHLMHR